MKQCPNCLFNLKLCFRLCFSVAQHIYHHSQSRNQMIVLLAECPGGEAVAPARIQGRDITGEQYCCVRVVMVFSTHTEALVLLPFLMLLVQILVSVLHLWFASRWPLFLPRCMLLRLFSMLWYLASSESSYAPGIQSRAQM